MENSTFSTLIVFILVSGAWLAGLLASRFWPPTHLDERSKDIAKLGIGIVVTMTVLILSLMLNSVKNNFDTTDRDLRQFATNIIVLDRSIKRYGPDAAPARALLRQYTMSSVDSLWPTGKDTNIRGENAKSAALLDGVENDLQRLQPIDPVRRESLVAILAQYDALVNSRWIFIDDSTSSILRPFFVVVIGWLMIIFSTIGLYAPRNLTIVVVMLMTVLSLSGAIFLMSEMETPFSGTIEVSSVPLHNALAQQSQ